jgi:hypothetical protein
MPKAPKKEYTLKERIEAIKKAGISEQVPIESAPDDSLCSLSERVQQLLGIVRKKGMKAGEMLFMIFYDIEDNKVRRLIAKYLKQKGCMRIQKSVFVGKAAYVDFTEIYKTL